MSDDKKEMQPGEYDCLRLENQLCFPLYACSKEVVRTYQPFLHELDLTYTQYITLMVLWEKKEVNVKEIGEKLYLDSGTLTPLLKKLEAKGYIKRTRSKLDERNVLIKITPEGEDLRRQALSVPSSMSRCIQLPMEDAVELRRILTEMMEIMRKGS